MGKLQLVLSNQGRIIQMNPHNVGTSSKTHKEVSYGLLAKNQKKVASKPIDFSEIQETSQSKLITEYSKTHANLTLDEDARKRMRVERLNKMNLMQDLSKTLDTKVLQDQSASDWEKMEHLKNVQRYRESTKASILSKVTEVCQV